MKKKQGFTLIELLAVIVILAVIALIATPIVIGIINDSKKKAVDNSANSILKAAEYYYTKSILDSSIVLTGQDNVFDKLEYQGEKPENGLTYVTQDGKIALSFKYGDTCYKKDYFDKELSKLEYNIDTCKVSPSNQTLVGGKVVTFAKPGENGLYWDEDGVYRYRGGGCTSFTTGYPIDCNGENPEINNYVKIIFDGIDYLYRIISIEKEGIKIQGINTTDTQPFDKGKVVATSCTDSTCPRYNANNTYCQVTSGTYYGCNLFTSFPGEIVNNGISSSVKGTVAQNSSLYEYLNLSIDASSQVKALRTKAKQNAKWTTGFLGYDNVNSETYDYLKLKKREQGIEYISTISLMTITDYAGASLDKSCQEKTISNYDCKNNNWLYSGKNEWTITPRDGYSSNEWIVTASGKFDYDFWGTLPSNAWVVRPVGYLSPETLFKGGTGTQSDPYTLD